MAAGNPELIFVSGPQKGERNLLMGVSGVIGRTPQCEICCRENFVSRQHVQMEMTHKGLVIENLSPNGTVVNGKRYKAGAKILLATGDVLGVGLETEILYVAAGDDPEAALADYRRQNEPATPAAPAAAQEALMQAPATGAEAKTASVAAAAPAGKVAPAEVSGAPRPAAAPAKGPARPAGESRTAPKEAPAEAPQQPKSKLKKYLKFILIYIGVLALLVGLLIVFKGSDENSASPAGYYLSKDDISKAMKASLPRKISPSQAQAALADADKLFDRRSSEPGNLYKVVRNYKVYLASKEGMGVFEDAEHNTRYETALKELIDAVATQYDNARAYEGKKDYATAQKIYGELLTRLPISEEGTPVHEVVVKNILLHYDFVTRKRGK